MHGQSLCGRALRTEPGPTQVLRRQRKAKQHEATHCLRCLMARHQLSGTQTPWEGPVVVKGPVSPFATPATQCPSPLLPCLLLSVAQSGPCQGGSWTKTGHGSQVAASPGFRLPSGHPAVCVCVCVGVQAPAGSFPVTPTCANPTGVGKLVAGPSGPPRWKEWK